MAEVCFRREDLNLYVFLLLVILIFVFYIIYKQREQFGEFTSTKAMSNKELELKIKELQEKLQTVQIKEQQCQSQRLQSQSQGQPQLQFDRIYNPMISPNRFYQSPYIPQAEQSIYQMIGFVYKDNERYPLYGRYKYPGRSDRWEYYIIDETRNRLKIPIKSRNDNELYDNDIITIPELNSDYTVKIYEYDTFRYNPNIL